jgi:tRNA (guanine37-N1)-methyltransferase
MSPRGTPFTQAKAHELANEEELTIICSRFEGIDQRVLDEYEAEDISIGDYILTGGEQASMIMLDAVIRLLPNVLGNSQSTIAESFEEILLEHPQYTRPTNWNGHEIPEVLLSGHHKNIEQWRHQQSEEITKQRRPDLWEKYLASKKV